MRALKRSLTIGVLALGLTAVSTTSYAGPVCLTAGYPTVIEVGQVGAPGNPVMIGGYLVAYNGDDYQKIPLVGSMTLNTDGTVNLGWTSHFDWGSGNWDCPVGDTVINTTLTDPPTYDNTYHGGDPEDVDADCPNSFQGNVEIISCVGYAPFDPDLIEPLGASAKGPNTR